MKKLLAAALIAASLSAPVYAEPVTLPEKPDNLETLWEMYVDLLEDYNALQARLDALEGAEEDTTEEEAPEGFSYEYEEKKLTFQRAGLSFAEDQPVVFLFFAFENGSKDTTSAASTFALKLFCDGIEQSAVMPWYTPEEYDNARTEVRPGYSLDVAFAFYVDPDAADVSLDIDKRAIVLFGKSTNETFALDLSAAPDLELKP